MNISHFLRFKATDSDYKIYNLVSKYILNDTELLNFNNSFELNQEQNPDFDVYTLFSKDAELAEICFPEDKFCYGLITNSNDLIIGKRIRKKLIIELIVIKDHLQYSHIHYQALRKGKYRRYFREFKRKP